MNGLLKRILMAVLLTSLALPWCTACNSAVEIPAKTISGSPVKALDFMVTDPAPDAVLTIYVQPRDDSGKILQINGAVDARLFARTPGKPARGILLDSWQGLTLESTDFRQGAGTLISLMAKESHNMHKGETVEVELSLRANGTQSATATGLAILGKLPSCCLADSTVTMSGNSMH